MGAQASPALPPSGGGGDEAEPKRASPAAVFANPTVPVRHEGDDDEAAGVQKKRARDTVVVGSEVELTHGRGRARVVERNGANGWLRVCMLDDSEAQYRNCRLVDVVGGDPNDETTRSRVAVREPKSPGDGPGGGSDCGDSDQAARTKPRTTAVEQIDVQTGSVVRVWDSMAHATRELELAPCSISRACLGKTHVVGGFRGTRERGPRS